MHIALELEVFFSMDVMKLIYCLTGLLDRFREDIGMHTFDISVIDVRKPYVQALVLVPTREFGMQVRSNDVTLINMILKIDLVYLVFLLLIVTMTRSPNLLECWLQGVQTIFQSKRHALQWLS